MDWKEECGYKRSPVNFENVNEYYNIPKIRSYLYRKLLSLGIKNINVVYEDNIIDAFGLFMDKFGHRVSFSVGSRIKYGGKLYARLRFPYYGDLEPRQLTNFFLLGDAVFFEFGLDVPPELIWEADIAGPPFPRLDQFLTIFEAVISYLRE